MIKRNLKIFSLQSSLRMALNAKAELVCNVNGKFNEFPEEVIKQTREHLEQVIEKMITELAEIYKNKN